MLHSCRFYTVFLYSHSCSFSSLIYSNLYEVKCLNGLFLCFFSAPDHCDLQVLPRLYRSEGVPGHHRGSAIGFSGRDSQQWGERQLDYRRAGRPRSGPPSEDSGQIHRHFYHCPASGQLPDLRHPHARGHPGLFRGEWRSAALPSRLPTQRTHQRAHAGPPEPAAALTGHQHRAGSTEASSPGLHGGAGHSQV